MSEIIQKAWREVKLSDLSVRYIPIVTPIELWSHDMSLTNSPHVELMRLFAEHGLDMEKVKDTRYYEERKRRHDIGMKKWTRTKLKEHIKKRYAIYKSIKKRGFREKLGLPIRVLKKPFWTTRFGVNEEWMGGYELWNGSGRASALMALGEKKVRVMMCKDKHPGTKKKGKFKDKLRDVKGVFDEN
ncbi:MAG: hypothetical protein GY861_03675 [bacterium]|nr:hypothetical protein [bacterium]